MRIKVLFFGRLKEIVGRAEDEVEISEDERLADVFARYGARYPEAGRLRGSLVAAVNQEFATWDSRLRNGDEVAFLPPVSGG
jgi:molybdopterin converting factor subunit 1